MTPPTRTATSLTWLGRLSRAFLVVLGMLALWATLPVLIGWGAVNITSGSMSPRISTGDVVVYSPVGDTRLMRGHVVVIDDPARPGSLLTHRIAWVREDGSYITRGDANAENDSTPVPPDRVLGMGRLRVPWIGLPVVWLRDGSYAMLGAGLAVLLAAGAAAGRRRLSGSATNIAVTLPQQRTTEPAEQPAREPLCDG